MKSRKKTLWCVSAAGLLLVAFWVWFQKPVAPVAGGSNAAAAADPSPQSDAGNPVEKPAVPGVARASAGVATPTDATPTIFPASAPSSISVRATDPAVQEGNAQAPLEELAATARMYAAHAPLRSPEVADPDSAANRQILSTMVAKALAQPATPPPATPGTR